ncbi:MAG TPA: hypothetical protein PLQ67_05430 [Burkholderiaceae bacterium]|nr:hypothetical protein [Burkholderiaceae bacterium]
MPHRTPIALITASFILAACASSYELTLMPRNKGTLYYGTATEQAAGGPAQVSISIEDKTYVGTWVMATPETNTTGTVAVGVGFGTRHGGIGIGTPVVIENTGSRESKALLRADDGSGLRCDFKSAGSGRSGSGTCTDDQGLIYDVQIALKRTP